MDIHLLKNEKRLGSGEVEHGIDGVGKRGAHLMRDGWDRKFLMIYWGGDQNFSTSHEKCITNLPLLLQFQIIFFSTLYYRQSFTVHLSSDFEMSISKKK